jgi:pimeloyl-ACP methyl ester carboxylesterase
MLGYNLSVPPFVRKSLLTRTLDNDDVLPKVRKPVLITHGADDAVVKPIAVEQHKARLPHAQVHLMAGAGHAAFWDDPATFNRRLSAFANDL